MRVYAATGDYITVFPDDDYDPTLNLRAASRVVARATRAARYDVDSAGNSTRLRITDLRTGRVRFLDALELETLVWLPDGHLVKLLDPSADRWKDGGTN